MSFEPTLVSCREPSWIVPWNSPLK